MESKLKNEGAKTQKDKYLKIEWPKSTQDLFEGSLICTTQSFKCLARSQRTNLLFVAAKLMDKIDRVSILFQVVI